MESKIDSFSKLSSRSMSFSVKEETKGEELFFTKFPTFEDITMDQQLKSNITIETLESDIQNCDEMLTNLKSSLENLFTTNQIIVDKFAEYKINYISSIIHIIYIKRQIGICYHIYEYKYRQEIKESFETFLFQLNIKYNLSTNIEEQYNELAKENPSLYGRLTVETVQKVKEEMEGLYKNETIMRNLDLEHYNPGIETFCVGVKFINMILVFLFEDLKELRNDIKEEKNIVTFFADLARLQILAEYCNYLFLFSSDDIFNKNEEQSEEWTEIKKYHHRMLIYPRYIVKKQLQKVFDVVNLGYASVSKSFSEYNNDIMRTATTGFYMAYYFFNKKKAQTQSKKFLMNPDSTVSQTIWNMMDSKGIKQAIKLALPSIKYNKKFFVKRTEPIITLEEIIKLAEQAKTFNPSTEIPHLENTEIDTTHSLLLVDKVKTDEEPNYDVLIKETNKESDNRTDDNYIKIKVYHSLNLKLKRPKGGFLSFCRSDSSNITRNAILIHIHGGGFVAMSPSSHENYTRKWANGLGIPIFSIDYRLSPEHPFPKALDDVYQAYMWIIKYGEDYFRMKIDNIILAGDSAGGNLVVALTYLLIMKKARLPTVLFIFYPALKMCLDVLSLSYFNAITDPVLEFNLLKFCVKSYQGEYENTKNPFLSPLYMDDNVLKFLPPVRIFGGTADPLRDDSIYFMERLLKLKKKVKMIEFKYFPHGFLNYDIKMMMPEAAVINEMVIKDMDKYITKKPEDV